MPSSCAHTIHREQSHFGWDNSFEPKLTVAPGESVEFHTIDASGGQLGPDSKLADVAALVRTLNMDTPAGDIKTPSGNDAIISIKPGIELQPGHDAGAVVTW